jgi:hypothetical protein
MVSWRIKQSKGVECDIDILGAASYTVNGSLVGGGGVRKYQTDFLTSGFTYSYQLVNWEQSPQCVVCGEVLTDNDVNARNLHTHLTTKYDSLSNKPLQCFERKPLEMCKQS